MPIAFRYDIVKAREQPPTRWVDLIMRIEIPPRHSVKVLGWFFYVALLTKRKHESKQCQKKYAERQHIPEIKLISHRHHPHSIQNRGQPTLQHGCPCSYLIISSAHFQLHSSVFFYPYFQHGYARPIKLQKGDFFFRNM